MDHLIESVLLRLPLPKIFELRLICKAWNTLLRSAQFAEAWSRHRSRQREDACLVIAPSEDWWTGPLADKSFIAYFPSLHRCYRLPHSFADRPPWQACCSARTMDSSSGLLCALNHAPTRPGTSTHDFKNYAISIFNPLKSSSGRMEALIPVPLSFHDEVHVCGTVLAETTEVFISRDSCSATAYKVLLVGFSRFMDRIKLLQMYDSAQGCWCSIAPPPLRLQNPSDDAVPALESFDDSIVRADLFLRTCLPQTRASSCIYGYHVSSDSWSYVSLKGIPEDGLGRHSCRRSMAIMKHKDSLIIAVCRNQFAFAATMFGFSVYRLEFIAGCKTRWKHIAETPEEFLTQNMLDTFGGIYIFDPYRCFVSGVSFAHNRNLICMVPRCSKPKPAPQDRAFPRPLVYDLDTNSWFFLPSYMNRRDGFAVFSYRPSFI